MRVADPCAGGNFAQLCRGVVNYTVAANSDTSSRSGSLTVAGLAFTVTQAGNGGSTVGDLPPGPCVSGQVDYISFSRATVASRLADEVSIGGIKLCATCEWKPPLYGNFAQKLERARNFGLIVDACYDSLGTMNFVRMRQ